MLRFGNVCDLDASRGYARVEFDEDGITSAFIPVMVANAKENKYFALPAINEQVVCLMDEQCEQGVILGALYSQIDAPTGFSPTQRGAIFESGALSVYDSASDKFSIANAVQNLALILSDLMDAHIAETHTTGTGPSGPPINLATYQGIKARLGLLFE